MFRTVKIITSFLVLCSIILLNVNESQYSAAQFSNKRYHWGFKRSVNHEPPSAGEKFDEMLTKYDAFYLGNTRKKDIYLTFDNGYENGYTEQILNVLKQKEVPAAFFVTGHYLKDQPALVKRMTKEGHIVGNHSWGHPDLTTVSDQTIQEELAKVNEEFRRLTKQGDMTYLRPPRGIFSERTLAISQAAGYQNVFWSLAFVDWKTDQQRGWKYAYDNIMKQIHPGAILLLHTVSKDNAEALGKAIDDLRKQGYHFKSLDDLTAQQHIPNPVLFAP